MKGYVSMEFTPGEDGMGVSTDCRLREVDTVGKVYAFRTLMSVLHVDPVEMLIIMEDMTSVMVKGDKGKTYYKDKKTNTLIDKDFVDKFLKNNPPAEGQG